MNAHTRRSFLSTKAQKECSRERGLTLIEILIVLILVALIGGFMFKKVFGMGETAKAQLTETKMQSFKESLFMYQMKNNQYPADLKAAGIEEPNDAWNRPVQYRLIDGNRAYEMKSLGSDGKEGGSGADADIVVKGP